MIVKELIHTEIHSIASDQPASEALNQINNYNVSGLPVFDIETGLLLGLLTQEEAENVSPATPVGQLALEKSHFIYERQHIFVAARIMFQYEDRILPVLDEEDKRVKGLICKKDVQAAISTMLNLAEQGSVIAVEMRQRDFSLSEVVQLIETEGAKILGLTVETSGEIEGDIRVSIKLNVKDVSRVTAALRRYEYIVTSETRDEAHDMDMQARAGELLHFLDM